MDDLNAFVAPYLGIVVVALVITCVLLVIAVAALARRASRLDRRLAGVTRGSEGSLESILDAHLDKVYAVAHDLDDVSARTKTLETAQRRALQRTGMVRFNPFEDTGGNQSFALAILDAVGTGLVISSLHSRTGTRIYGKTITGGKAETALSDEEAEALRLALASGTGPAKGA